MASNMFANYDNINPEYTPSNIPPINPCKPNLDPCRPKRQYEEYNDKGELIGYSWNYGDTIDLEFNIEGIVTIEDDTNPTYIDASEYIKDKKILVNIYDYRGDVIAKQELNNSSYLESGSIIKATSVINGVAYTQDSTLTTILVITQKSILASGSTIKANSMVNGVTTLVDTILTDKETLKQGTLITFIIDVELSKKLIKGLYTLTLTLIQDNNKEIVTIFNENDCTLIVK